MTPKRNLQAFGAYFCRTFFLFGEVDRSLSFCPKWDGRSLILRWLGQSMRSPRVMGLGTDALRQSKRTSRQANAWLLTNHLQTTIPIILTCCIRARQRATISSQIFPLCTYNNISSILQQLRGSTMSHRGPGCLHVA